MIEVLINGTSIDLISKGVKYTKQVNDLADISKVNTSYTFTIKADKTPKNTRLFQQLGMVGDTSKIPYEKNVTTLIDNGAVLITKGISTVKETAKDYKIYIQDGIVDVFKLIENKSIGLDLDLNELEHSKNAQTIIDSWGSQDPNIEDAVFGYPYRYLISDYNGKTNDLDGIDSAYQIPSVNVKYLWDKVFNYVGFTYSGNFDFIQDKWITYPKPPELEENEIINRLEVRVPQYNGRFPSEDYKTWETPIVQNEVVLLDNLRVKTNITGNYRIAFSGTGIAEIETYRTNLIPFLIRLFVNGQAVRNLKSDANTDMIYEGFLPADSIIQLKIEVDTNTIEGPYTLDGIVIDFLELKIQTTDIEVIDFRSVLSDFSIKDFFKEVIFRGALTPFTDNVTKHIDFKNLTDRLRTNPNNVNNLSKKYVRRIKETYEFGTYAQKNILQLKYNNAEDNHFNGNLLVENKNIEDQKILFDSKFYAPEKDPVNVLFITGGTPELLPLIKLWEKEIKEDSQGNQTIEYKPLSNKFYFLSSKLQNRSIKVNGVQVSKFYTASTNGTSMQEVINSRYNQINKIFTDTRIHEIELALSAYDFQSIDLSKLQYLEQEGQFYILNRLIWESKKLAIGEFLRVKKI